MKTISGKSQHIEEGILNSVNAGKKVLIDKFLSDTMYANQYDLNPDMSISIRKHVYSKSFLKRIDIPVWIKECETIIFEECEFETYVLPETAKSVRFFNCKKLKYIKPKDGVSSTIDELWIEDCQNIDLTALKGTNIKKVKIVDTNITSLKGLEDIKASVYIKGCLKLKNFDVDFKNNPELKLVRCAVKDFSSPINSIECEIKSSYFTKKIDIKLGTVEDFIIEDAKKLENLTLSGNMPDTIVVRDSTNLTEINSIGAKISMSFVELPNIETYTLPEKMQCVCVFEEVKTVPEISCKKKIVR